MPRVEIEEVYAYWCQKLAPAYGLQASELMSMEEVAAVIESMTVPPQGKVLRLRDYPATGGLFLAAVAVLVEMVWEDERLRGAIQLLFELETGLPFRGLQIATLNGELVWHFRESTIWS
ncbi:MAG: hypothetical protein QXT73_02390 [Candidatus Methanomethylicaceae archaeon]